MCVRKYPTEGRRRYDSAEDDGESRVANSVPMDVFYWNRRLRRSRWRTEGGKDVLMNDMVAREAGGLKGTCASQFGST